MERITGILAPASEHDVQGTDLQQREGGMQLKKF
jgi:hypothetical protein